MANRPEQDHDGTCKEHGIAHTQDHARWSRRDFLSSMGLVASGGALLLGSTPLRAFGESRLLRFLDRLETDRILVLIQLSGGNDGLNNVVPITNDLYYNARPQIAIPANKALSIPGQNDLGLHPSFSSVVPRYGDGQMAVLQNVGYPEPRLSHFESTDVWLTANDSRAVGNTGWIGRYLDGEYPGFDENPTDHPVAVQMGGTSSLLFQGPVANMGMTLASPDLFQRLAEEGVLYSIDGLPDTRLGQEIGFVRTVANDSFFYAEAVQKASETGQNQVEYPTGNPLAENLSIVAKLITGRLGARIYHVSIGSFDTHAGQGAETGQHANLLRNLTEAIDSFLEDLEMSGSAEDVLVATFSEFGRRVAQNGSGGTDHGTAAPLFLFGAGLEGGMYGNMPNLNDLDQTGNLKYDIDFRDVYATLLQDWFGLTEETVNGLLGGTFKTLAFVSDPAMPTASQDHLLPASFELEQNYPNPFTDVTTISYRLHAASLVSLSVYDSSGRLVATPVDAMQPAGRRVVSFDASHLASGTYLYRLKTASGVETRQMTLVR